jgi:hypothetical protein
MLNKILLDQNIFTLFYLDMDAKQKNIITKKGVVLKVETRLNVNKPSLKAYLQNVEKCKINSIRSHVKLNKKIFFLSLGLKDALQLLANYRITKESLERTIPVSAKK